VWAVARSERSVLDAPLEDSRIARSLFLKAFSTVAAAIGLLLVWTVVPMLVIEGVIRAYEAGSHSQGIEAPIRSDVIHFDKLGYNQLPISSARSQREYRILSLGDSFARAITRPNYTYAAVLARHLSDAVSRPVSVVNLGRGRTSIPEYIAELDYWTTRMEYDAVIVNIYIGNDLGSLSKSEAKPPGGSPTSKPRANAPDLRHPSLIPRRYALRLFDYAYAIYGSIRYQNEPGDVRYRPRIMGFPVDRYLEIARVTRGAYVPRILMNLELRYAWIADLLHRLQALNERGIGTLVFLSPPEFIVSEALAKELELAHGQVEGLDPTFPAALVAAIADETGYSSAIYDILGCLRAHEYRDDPLYYPRNTHWSARGNDVVGRNLAAIAAADFFGLPYDASAADCELPAVTRPATDEQRSWAKSAIAPIAPIEGSGQGADAGVWLLQGVPPVTQRSAADR
jgi:hypothetical protein